MSPSTVAHNNADPGHLGQATLRASRIDPHPTDVHAIGTNDLVRAIVRGIPVA